MSIRDFVRSVLSLLTREGFQYRVRITDVVRDGEPVVDIRAVDVPCDVRLGVLRELTTLICSIPHKEREVAWDSWASLPGECHSECKESLLGVFFPVFITTVGETESGSPHESWEITADRSASHQIAYEYSFPPIGTEEVLQYEPKDPQRVSPIDDPSLPQNLPVAA